jgi:hypothetical protein
MNAFDLYGRQILTADDMPHIRNYRQWVEELVAQRYPRARVKWETAGGEVEAEVNYGEWRAVCPFCPGAMVITPSEPFFCVDCVMAGNAGYAMAIHWPDHEERVRIERVLLARPAPINMNYEPLAGETVETLMEENRARGFPAMIGE